MLHSDTIVALSTPPGRSGVAVIRISGPSSLIILCKLVGSESFDPKPNHLSLKNICDRNNRETIDEALVCFFKAPHSFTGEDVVELHCHGSPVVVRSIIDIVLSMDARLAGPGEFSLRAVSNGRLRLTEAEAIRDLIDSQTREAARHATRQMRGAVSATIQPAKDSLVKIIVRLESSLEFVEDDLPAIEQQGIILAVDRLIEILEGLASTFGSGKLLRDGIRVAFTGRPNVGKSSLFNSLVGHGRAIVTDIPGTTRDTLTEWVDLNGVPVMLIDTAGIRTAKDAIETIGVERARREAADADLLVVVLDGSEPFTEDDLAVLSETESAQHVVALNKQDVDSFSVHRFGSVANGSHSKVVSVSARSGAGLNELRTAILEPFDRSNGHDGMLITNVRHHDLLQRSVQGLKSSRSLLDENASEELILVGLYNALRFLGEITGETTADEILGQIFATFCIGK